MEIWTDGTIQPKEALSEAASVLVEHLLLVAGVEEEAPEEEAEEEGIPARFYEILIEDLDLNVRVYNCLKRTGITSVGEVLEKLAKGEEEMMSIRNFGPKSLTELMQRLAERGLLWTEKEEESEGVAV
jgi:DNA-directed RNA polymerase subunit alpha